MTAKPARHLRPVVPVVLAWLTAVVAWLAWRGDAIGGRPLTLVWSADPGEYDPHNTSHPIAQEVFRHVCEPLFYEDFDGVVRGLLAEDEVDYGAGGRRLTVRLHPEIRFHDGAALDALAVRHSFQRLTRLGVSPLASDLRDVRVTPGPDGRTVAFDLPEPDYEFVRLVLANPYAAIVSPHTGDLASPGLVACTGPYRFVPELYEPDESIAVVRWPEYGWPRSYFRNRGAARIPQLRFTFVDGRDGRYTELVDGEGCVLSVGGDRAADLAARPEFRLHEATGGVTYLGFNFQRPRWDWSESEYARSPEPTSCPAGKTSTCYCSTTHGVTTRRYVSSSALVRATSSATPRTTWPLWWAGLWPPPIPTCASRSCSTPSASCSRRPSGNRSSCGASPSRWTGAACGASGNPPRASCCTTTPTPVETPHSHSRVRTAKTCQSQPVTVPHRR